MSININDEIKEMAMTSLVNSMSEYIGIPKGIVANFTTDLIPVIISSACEFAKSTSGASLLYHLIDEYNRKLSHDDPTVFKVKDKILEFKSFGKRALMMIMGEQTGDVIAFHSKRTGLGGGSTSFLMMMVTAFIVEQLRTYTSGKELSDFQEFMSGQLKILK